MVNETICMYMLLAFLSGGWTVITANVISSFFTRKSFTNEPLFSKEPVPEIEEIEEEETQEERYSREAIEFKELRGQL